MDCAVPPEHFICLFLIMCINSMPLRMMRAQLRGQWKYLYCAMDKAGDTADFLLQAHRDKAVAMRSFERAIDRNDAPEIVTMDKSGVNLAALQAINAKREAPIKMRQASI